MARTPTWTELWSDAAKLAKIQKQCYQSVHQLLDSLPELDQKMEYLCCDGRQQQTNQVTNMDISEEINKSNWPDLLGKSFSAHELYQLGELYSAGDSYHMSRLLKQQQLRQPQYLPEVERTQLKEEPYYVEILDQPQKTHRIHRPTSQDQNYYLERPPQPEQHQRGEKLRNNEKQSHNTRSYPSGGVVSTNRFQEDLEHLKPLPMPLSEYLKLNRPEMVMRADRRAMYLKRKAERRKFNASTRTINAFEQMRSSRSGSNYSQPRLPRSQSHTYSVKYKLSEQEMKRLTAKTYKRLPEVKSKRKEEVSNHMKVQNYKNKLEYGRKLLENRRHGIINYPLRTSYDDNSFSSQDNFSTNGYGGAADVTSDLFY